MTDQPVPSELFNKCYKKQLYKDLLKTKEMIVREDYAFSMAYWSSPLHGTTSDVLNSIQNKYPACDTVRCIGGTIEFLMRSRSKNRYPDVYEHVRKNAPVFDRYALHNLFYPENRGPWEYATVDPNPYNATAEEACKVIDRFITHTHEFQEDE